MSIEQEVLERIRALPPDKQREVLDFAEFLRSRGADGQARRSVRGLWGDLGADVTDEDIAQARRELWGRFPRADL